MKVEYDQRSGNYNVTLSKEDLDKAFEDYDNFYLLLHNIVLETHGREIADRLYPL